MEDDSSKENDGASSIGESRGIKRSCSPREIEAKKARVEDVDTIILDDNCGDEKQEKSTPDKPKNQAGSTSSKKNTPKLSKEEREAERLKKAELRKQREEERERAKVKSDYFLSNPAIKIIFK
uniref:Uncharacterized protein n=1 Tax=Heterorhabditis bacteriophora TaxID=37862 RepID=A0A1I7X0Q3_HETBA